LALLREKKVRFKIRDYMNVPLSHDELQLLLKNHSRREIIRQTDAEEQALDLHLDEESLIKAIIKSPQLLQRPILVKRQQSMIGRPPERLLALL